MKNMADTTWPQDGYDEPPGCDRRIILENTPLVLPVELDRLFLCTL